MATRWHFNFVTLRGNRCDVYIRDNNYIGSVIELTRDVSGSPGFPADDPVTIDEDDSSDLLEDNVRGKTGYINLIESSSGSLSDMFAQNCSQFEICIFNNLPQDFDDYHYEEIDDAEVLSSHMLFHGFMKPELYDSNYLSYKENIKLPFQSASLVLKDVRMSGNFNTVLDIAKEEMSYYKWLVYPDITARSIYTGNDVSITDVAYSGDEVNSEYNYGIPFNGVSQRPYIYPTINKYLTLLCNMFGMVSHDVGDMLVLVKTGYNGNYKKAFLFDTTITHTVVGNGNDVVNISNFSYASDKNRISYLNPLHSVKYTWDKWEKEVEIDFKIAKYLNTNVNFSILRNANHNIGSTTHWSEQGDAYIANSVRIIGTNERELLLVQGTQTDDAMFHTTFGTPLNKAIYLHIEVVSGYQGSMRVVIMSNGKYLNFSSEGDKWVDSYNSNCTKTLTFDSNGACNVYIYGSNGPSLTVYFWYTGNSTLNMRFKTIRLIRANQTSRYSTPDIDHRDFSLDENSVETKEIDYNMGYKASATLDDYPSVLPYSIASRILDLYLFMETAVSELLLVLNRFSTNQNNNTNRVISIGRDVRNDIYNLKIIGNSFL